MKSSNTTDLLTIQPDSITSAKKTKLSLLQVWCVLLYVTSVVARPSYVRFFSAHVTGGISVRSSILGLLVSKVVLGLTAAALVTACGKDTPSFSLLAESSIFNQSTNVDTKVDVLFVVDNSGSMAPQQANLVNNFNAFISSFVTKGYDFHIGVIPSDTYKAIFSWGAPYARLKDGQGTSHSGVFVIDQLTPNIEPTFMTNATLGIGGSGDERAFQSFKVALDSSLNNDFRRPNAFLAIIILSDEDDFSHDANSDINENYSYSGLHTINYYKTYLDTLTGSTSSLRRYSVNSIHILDSTCLAASHVAANIGVRYSALVDATGGVKGDICSPSFSTELDKIQQGILTLASQFHLPRIPKVETIQVFVDGNQIPEGPSGWTYDAAANSIVFAYSALPPQGASIIINYDPVTIQ
jgi:hypothetical protein